MKKWLNATSLLAALAAIGFYAWPSWVIQPAQSAQPEPARPGFAAKNQVGVEPKKPAPDASGNIIWRIKTSAGELVVAEESAGIRTAKIAGKTWLEEDHIEPWLLIPNEQDARIVLLETSCGGSACVETLDILDANPQGVGLVQTLISSAQAKVALGPNGSIDIVGYAIGEETALGGRIVAKLRYDLKRQHAYRIGPGNVDFGHLVGEHPDDLFSDALTRGRLLKVLGEKNFKPVRQRLQVASGMRLLDQRFLVASGIMRHSGGSDEAIVVLDFASGNLWSIWVEDGAKFEMHASAKLDEDFIKARGALNEWLNKWGKNLK